MAKKKQNVDNLRSELDRKERSLQRKDFMSSGSKKIIRSLSRTLDKSQSQTSFLQRNYYNPHERSKAKGELSLLDQRRVPQERELSASKAGIARDMSGSKISFLNSSAGGVVGRNNRGVNGERLFSP